MLRFVCMPCLQDCAGLNGLSQAVLAILPVLPYFSPPACKRFTQSTPDALQVVENARIIFIATKPQYVKAVLAEVKHLLTPEHIIVSIAAGVPLSAIKVCRKPFLYKPFPRHLCLRNAVGGGALA